MKATLQKEDECRRVQRRNEEAERSERGENLSLAG